MKVRAERGEADAVKAGRNCHSTRRVAGRIRQHAKAVVIVAAGITLATCYSAYSETMKYQTLANESDVPFLKHGEPPNKDEHKVAVKKWPDVRSCLIESERKKKTPDIRLIDWDQLYTVDEADVCLFRIFSSIGSVGGVIKWLEYHGFEIDGPHRPDVKKKFLGERVDYEYVNASISIGCGEVKAKFPTCCLNSLWINFIAHGQTISSSWTMDGKLIDVHNSLTIK